MFEQAFKNIDDVLWKEAGCTTELDYTEQTSWMLFLKYLDDLEQERAMEAELVGKSYDFLIYEPHRWSAWAAPKKPDGSFDHDNALTGDDLIEYVNRELFPYLQGFKGRASGPDTIEYKIGEIFGEIKNKFQSGYSLRDALEYMDALRFRSQKEKHELSHLYEAKIRNMGNAGRNGGEYYTPRPLIRAMVRVTGPKIGETIYDGACGSAGFLCESYEYLRPGELTTAELEKLQARTFYGKEKKSLAYIIGIMNMILHGIEAPNIIHTNTLTENLADIHDYAKWVLHQPWTKLRHLCQAVTYHVKRVDGNRVKRSADCLKLRTFLRYSFEPNLVGYARNGPRPPLRYSFRTDQHRPGHRAQ